MNGLPWNWEQKLADFIKPGDPVLDLGEADGLSGFPENSFQVVFGRDSTLAADYAAVRQILRPGGFFLTEQTGGENARILAGFLTPGSRPANGCNLENELPRLRAAGFRILYRDQWYGARAFGDLQELLDYVQENPQSFPGFSREASEKQLQLFSENGGPELTEHRFILIGKKQG